MRRRNGQTGTRDGRIHERGVRSQWRAWESEERSDQSRRQEFQVERTTRCQSCAFEPHIGLFSYFEESFSSFKDAEKFILATDNDAPGLALSDELARRFGAWKCWKVNWPTNFESTIRPHDGQTDDDIAEEEKRDDARWHRKDANEVLQRDSAEALRWYVESAQAYPVHGLHKWTNSVTTICHKDN